MDTPRRIFIIDDDKNALESLKRLLVMYDFVVELCDNPKEAVALAKSFSPDLILLDLRMPHLGGFEVCEMLNNDKDTYRIPIIVVSALGDMADIKKAYKLGAIGYITKPYDFKDLLEKINQAVPISH